MTDGSPMTGSSPSSRSGRWIGLAVGVPIMAYGIRGALVDTDRTHPAELARWVIGAAVVHDLLFAPAVLALGWLLTRALPPWARPPARWALATSVVLTLFAWPFVRGYGESATVPSLFPRNYAAGLLAYLAVVWLAAAAWAVLARRQAR